MRVSVVIPSRDGAHFLRPCLEALARSVRPPGVELQVVVVDNGSTDGSPALLRSLPGVEAVVVDHPLGFSHANNAARAVARGDVVCFLNNDTTVQRDWLARPLEILASDPDVAAVGAKLLFMHRFVACRFELAPGARGFVSSTVFDGPLDPKVRWSADAGGEKDFDGRRGRWVRDGSVVYLPIPVAGLDPAARSATLALLAVDGAGGGPEAVGLRVAGDAERLAPRTPGVFVVDGLDARPTTRLVQNAGNFLSARAEGGDFGSGEEDRPGRFDQEEVVPALCGAALFVRRRALDEAGWFPTYYGMYYEDTDLCLRLRQRGGHLVFCPSSVVDHYHTGTNREFSPKFIEHVAGSSLLFAFRFGSPWLLLRVVVRRLKRALRELRGLRGARWRDRWAGAHATRGTLSGVRRLGPVLRERLGDLVAGRPLSGRLLRLGRSRYVAVEPASTAATHQEGR